MKHTTPLLLLLAALSLRAQDKAPSRSGWVYIEPGFKVSKEYCRIDQRGVVKITPGFERECWEELVKSHNRGIENSAYHRDLNRILEAVAKKLNKPFRRDAR